MRFHMGVSFRLKTLKRFLLPFLIGVLAYFGISSFNIMQVHAYNSTTTFYRYQYDEIDWDDIQTNGDYSFQDILNITQIPSSYYYIDSYVVRDLNVSTNVDNYRLVIHLLPKSGSDSLGIRVLGMHTNNTDNYYINYAYSTSNISKVVLWNGMLSNTMTTQQFQNLYSKYYNCLTENNCDSNYFATNTDIPYFKIDNFGTIANNTSYNVNYKDYLFDSTHDTRFMPYYANISTNYTAPPSTTLGSQFYKKTSINGIGVSGGEYYKHYCDLYDCSADTPSEWITGIVDTPTFNIGGISPNDITSLNIELHMSLLSGNIDSDNPFPYLYNFYGRKDNSTYYSYEKIDCFMGQMYGIGSDNVYNYYVNNVSCTTDLTPYDNIYINIYPYGYFTANNIQFTTNYGWTYTSPLLHHYSILEKFENLPSDINILLSTNDYITSAYFVTDNEYMFNALVNRDTNKISGVVGNKYQQFGTYDNTSLMIYNLKSVNNYSTELLYIFFQQDTILSVGDNGSFTYYDSSGNITDGNIVNNYQAYTDESYNLSYYFNQVNDFLDDLDADLLSVHDIFQNIYNSIPNFFQVCITIFYILLLTYLLFKFIRS